MSVAMEHPLGPVTVDDWLTREAPDDGSRLELILGYLHMNPAPTGRHQYGGDELRLILREALREDGRKDLYAVTGVGVEISTSWRTALIPDVVVLNTKPLTATFQPEDLELVVEIWSPSNSSAERDTKAAAYVAAKIPFFWEVTQGRTGSLTVATHVLKDDQYVEDVSAGPGKPVTFTAAPVPVTFDPASLHP